MLKPILVSKSHPCLVCKGDHKCSYFSDGLLMCGRCQGEQEGFRWLGPCKNPVWHMYRLKDDNRPRHDPPVEPKPVPPPDFPFTADLFANELTRERLDKLASTFGLPVDVFARIYGIGFDPTDGAFTFPEVDCGGRIIGILKRFPDGSKRMVPSSRRGITMPGGWADEEGPLFLVEGPSDTLALLACGLSVLGRSSNMGGAEHLIPLLAKNVKTRPIVVVGENDAKPDGQWPGKEGAKKLAASLATGLERIVHATLPPPAYKDVRKWVNECAGSPPADGFNWAGLGARIRDDLYGNAVAVEPPDRKNGPVCMKFDGLPLPRRYPMPIRIGELTLPAAGGVNWVWDGLLARDSVTLLSALPKCGKTTLLGHLLAELPNGGLFCGRNLVPGKAIVVSEEPAGVWASRRDELGIPPDSARLFTRGAFTKAATLDDWTGFLAHLTELLTGDPADLVVFDTIANLWPVKDENSAAEVTQAMAPLHKLCAGRSVLLVHHLRKSDGGEGTGSRGSGAIAGFVDVILELRRQKTSTDPRQRRRTITGYGRYDAIPAEWMIELVGDPASGRLHFEHVAEAGEGQPTNTGRDAAVRIAVLNLLSDARDRGEAGMTRRQLWDGLPDDLRVNENRFRQALTDGEGSLWTKEERAKVHGGPLFHFGCNGGSSISELSESLRDW